MNPDLLDRISNKTGIPEDQVRQVAEELLAGLHKRFDESDSDYVGELAPYELGDRGFYHLLGLLEQFTIKYGWSEGSAGEYLGRMPPMDRWKPLRDEREKWHQPE
jgi:hypothetical protein